MSALNLCRGLKAAEAKIHPNLVSHPYRLISPWKSKQELAAYLLANIVHHSDGVLAVNKPYGVGVSNVQDVRNQRMELAIKQGKYDWHNPPKMKEPSPVTDGLYHTRGVPISPYTIADVLPILRAELGLKSLILAKSTEKFSSGVAVFAEKEEISERMKYCHKGAKACKIRPSSYLVISSLVPQLDNGKLQETVGVSIKEVEWKGRASKLPIIERKFSNQRMKSEEVIPVQTEVTTHSFNSYLNASLAEIQTTVTKSFFLRIYCVDLLMPILGDHLFSNRIQSMMDVPFVANPLSVEPGASNQKLSNDLLGAISLGHFDDSIIIPLHAHLQWYTIPNFYGKKKHLVITAPPPQHFRWTCARLKLDLDRALQSRNLNDR